MEPNERATFLWNNYKEECDWMRHNETQRGNLSAILIAAYGALLAFLPKERPLYCGDWPMPTLIVVLGTLGVIAVFKYWERFMFHSRVSWEFRKELDKLVGGIQATWDRGKKEHEDDRAVWPHDRRLLQHRLWIGFHAIAALLGAVLLITALAGGHRPESVR